MNETKLKLEGILTGILFDFAANLTTQEKEVKIGASNPTGAMIDLLRDFIEKRELSDKYLNVEWESAVEDFLKDLGETDGEAT